MIKHKTFINRNQITKGIWGHQPKSLSPLGSDEQMLCPPLPLGSGEQQVVDPADKTTVDFACLGGQGRETFPVAGVRKIMRQTPGGEADAIREEDKADPHSQVTL